MDRLVTEPLAAPWGLGCSFPHQWREALGAQPTPAPGQTGRRGKWPGAISELRDQREEAGQDSAGDRVPLQGGLGPCACLLPLPSPNAARARAAWRPFLSVTSSFSPVSMKLPGASLLPSPPALRRRGRGNGGGHMMKSPAPGVWPGRRPGRYTHLSGDLAVVVKVIQGEGPLLPAVLLHRHVTLQLLDVNTQQAHVAGHPEAGSRGRRSPRCPPQTLCEGDCDDQDMPGLGERPSWAGELGPGERGLSGTRHSRVFKG